MVAQLSKMRSLQETLSSAGGLSWFTWTLFSTKEVREMGIRDPACSVLRGEMGPVCIEIDADGETGMGYKDNMETVLGILDLSRPKATILAELYSKIKGETQAPPTPAANDKEGVPILWRCPKCGHKHTWHWEYEPQRREMTMCCDSCQGTSEMLLTIRKDGTWLAK